MDTPTIPAVPTLASDYSRLRGALAVRRISHTCFARVCGLNRSFVSRVLCGYPAGELARIKIARGAQALGLDLEVHDDTLQ